MTSTPPNSDPTERIPVYEAEPAVPDTFACFKGDWGNVSFRRSRLTWLALAFLLVGYPGISIAFAEDPTIMLRGLNEAVRMILLLSTIIMQWGIFLLLFLAVAYERTGLAGIGLKRIRWIDLAWAVAFLVAANLILSGLAWVLAQVGLPLAGEINMLIPSDLPGRIVWVGVSFTAGFCEEAAFRGYLMTRLRLVGQFTNWVIPTILSAAAFGACHAYQGLPGFIVITVYGLMFSLLYIRTGSLWPCVIAHFFQDFGALFFPQ